VKLVVMVWYNGGWAYLGKNDKAVDSKFKARTFKTEVRAQKAREKCGFYQTMVSEQ